MLWDYYSSKNKGNSDTPTGADELLPVLILLVFDSEIPDLATQAYFIRKFRQENLLSGQGEYYITTFEGTLDYIIKLQPKINLEDKELADGMAEIDMLAPTNQPKPTEEPKVTKTAGTGASITHNKGSASPKFDFPLSPLASQHHSHNLKALQTLRDSTKQFLYENNEKYITLKDKSLSAMFVGDLDRLHYEYNFMLSQYKQLSQAVGDYLKQSTPSLPSQHS